MEVFKWLKKEWPVLTGPTYSLEMRSHLFRRFRERPDTEKSGQNPLSRELPAQLKRFIINAKIGICRRRCLNNVEPPHNEAALHYGKRALVKGRNGFQTTACTTGVCGTDGFCAVNHVQKTIGLKRKRLKITGNHQKKFHRAVHTQEVTGSSPVVSTKKFLISQEIRNFSFYSLRRSLL